MKKIFTYLIILLSLSLIVISGCNFNVEEEKKTIAKPDVSAQSDAKGIYISRAKYSSSVKTITVLRKKVDVVDPKDSKIFDIGHFSPSADTTTDKFYDDFLKTGDKYSYCFKYYDGKEYIYTDWSDKIEAPSGCISENEYRYVFKSDVNLTYDASNEMLVLTNISADSIDNSTPLVNRTYSTNNTDKEFEPSVGIIFKIDNSSKIFPITPDTPFFIKTLPNEYIGKTITYEGIVTIYKEKTDSKTPDYRFTEPNTTIKFYDTEPKEITSFKYGSSESISGIDYKSILLK